MDGEGARLSGGRWNRPGTAVVYASATVSLAVLELFVHTDTDLLPEDLVLVRVEIPDDCPAHMIAEGDLPRDWRGYPAPEVLQEMGTAWAAQGRTLVLSVPSAVIPQERNYLINPQHPDFDRISIGVPEAFRFDPRLIP